MAEISVGNVILTSVGEALQKITDFFLVKGYYEMVNGYMKEKGMKVTNQHEYDVEENGDSLNVFRRRNDG